MPTDPTPTCAPAQPLLVYSPWSGCRLRLLATSDPNGFRNRHGCRWDFNPWTGSRRPAAEVEADPQGLKLEPPSHDPGTTSPPTPATTEAGTGTQEPGATDHEPASTSSPTPCAAPSAMNAVLSSLGAAVAEVNALTRTAVELSAKCRALQEENDRLRGLFRQIAVNADQSHFGGAVSLLAEEALNPKPGTGPHMRAAAGEGDGV